MRKPIIVVSGLPRSGTSMIMQMLKAGGMELLDDEIRTPDEDNPRGYFEYDPVKRLKEDASWLTLAEGRAVKVISYFLTHLPESRTYKVIFLDRPLEEILKSQAKMLQHRGKDLTRQPPDATLKKHLEMHLKQVTRFLDQKPCFDALHIGFRNAITDPSETAAKIAHFLPHPLQVDDMATVVNPALYRNRISP